MRRGIVPCDGILAVVSMMLKIQVRNTIQSGDNSFKNPGGILDRPQLFLLSSFCKASCISIGAKGLSVTGISGPFNCSCDVRGSASGEFIKYSKCYLNHMKHFVEIVQNKK